MNHVHGFYCQALGSVNSAAYKPDLLLTGEQKKSEI